jgi:hypothetical protein
MYSNARYVEAGGLMTYAHDRNEQIAAPLSMSIKFLRVQNLLTYLWSDPQSLSW